MTNSGNRLEENPPDICEVYLSSGEIIDCHSADEFDELVKEYVNDDEATE